MCARPPHTKVMHKMPDLVLQQSEANASKGGNTGDDARCATAAGAKGGSKGEIQGYSRAMVGGKTAGATDAENKGTGGTAVHDSCCCG